MDNPRQKSTRGTGAVTYWNEPRIVANYAAREHLDPPEATLLSDLRQRIHEMDMLDIAIGAGRTTSHFSPRVRSYFGIDRSQRMIDACRRRFPGIGDQLQVCEAAELENFPDDAFDLILISYAGLDYITWDERARVFQELSRIGRAGGFFALCSHNTGHLASLFLFHRQFYFKPREWHKNSLRKLGRWMMRRFVHNRSLRIRTAMEQPYVGIYDSHYFRMKLVEHYAEPFHQIRELERFFDGIKVFSFADGRLLRRDELGKIEDQMLFYVCRIRA